MSVAAFEAEPPVILPAVPAAQMAEVDRIMVEDLGIALVQMMENAGRNLAQLTITRWQPERVIVMAGPGGNGGGGMVAARHLANRGSDVEVVLSDPTRLADVPARQRTILDAMVVPVHDPEPRSALLPALLADATLTLALPKTGLVAGAAQVGELYVADISVPPSVYEPLGISIASPFREVGIRRAMIAA